MGNKFKHVHINFYFVLLSRQRPRSRPTPRPVPPSGSILWTVNMDVTEGPFALTAWQSGSRMWQQVAGCSAAKDVACWISAWGAACGVVVHWCRAPSASPMAFGITNYCIISMLGITLSDVVVCQLTCHVPPKASLLSTAIQIYREIPLNDKFLKLPLDLIFGFGWLDKPMMIRFK